MLADDFDPNALPTEAPAKLDGRRFECGVPITRQHATNLCTSVAELFANQLKSHDISEDHRPDVLRQLVVSWADDGHIPRQEFVWTVRKAAGSLGWDCPDSIFEVRLHCWLPTSVEDE
jgi:hypothetical protein